MAREITSGMEIERAFRLVCGWRVRRDVVLEESRGRDGGRFCGAKTSFFQNTPVKQCNLNEKNSQVSYNALIVFDIYFPLPDDGTDDQERNGLCWY